MPEPLSARIARAIETSRAESRIVTVTVTPWEITTFAALPACCEVDDEAEYTEDGPALDVWGCDWRLRIVPEEE